MNDRVDIFETTCRLLDAGRRAEAVAFVARAAASGHPDALFQQAIWHLVGDPLPRDLPQSRANLAAANDSGHIDAGLMEIALTANGTGAPADWPTALASLKALGKRAPVAAAQLSLLDNMQLGTAGEPLSLPTPEVLGEEPRVILWRALLTREECNAVAASVEDILEPAAVLDPRTGARVAHPVRTSDGAVIGPTRENLVIRAINRRLAAITGTDVTQGEALMVLRYAPGQQYRPHIDTIQGVSNQRIKTVLVYLNHGYDGGETRFESNGVTVVGRTGDAIVFDNILPNGSPDVASRHAGLPVRRGTKWLATRWIRARPVDPWNPATTA